MCLLHPYVESYKNKLTDLVTARNKKTALFYQLPVKKQLFVPYLF
jgi:hypothetical protein